MRIRSEFDQPAIVQVDALEWVPSPMPGVSRRMLDRIGDEVARATTVVRYDVGSHFSAHVHSGGEEFIVLEGVFQDEHGDYPVGSYVRNPPTSRHTPGAEDGCVIFVKLWQFHPDDREEVRIQMNDVVLSPLTPTVQHHVLFEREDELVQLMHWAPNTTIELAPEGGVEILVLDGLGTYDDTALTRHTWIRLPVGAPLVVKTGAAGMKVWMKSRHLATVRVPSSI